MTDCDYQQTGWRKYACNILTLARPLCSYKLKQLDEYQLTELMQIRNLYFRTLPNAWRRVPSTIDEWRDWCEYVMDKPDWLYEQSLMTRIGLAFAWGTTCPCCLGWRTLVFAVAAGAVGYLVAKP